jgi:Ni,Fe-hydrogenase III small subunit
MNKTPTLLKLFNFSHPLMETELLSLAGDKYSHALPFSFEFVEDFKDSDVILWDGVITAKNTKAVETILNGIGPDRILMLIGESFTLFHEHPLVQLVDSKNLNVLELPGWSVLPEEIIVKLEECFKKLKNV